MERLLPCEDPLLELQRAQQARKELLTLDASVWWGHPATVGGLQA